MELNFFYQIKREKVLAKEEHIEDLMMESSAVLLDRGLLNETGTSQTLHGHNTSDGSPETNKNNNNNKPNSAREVDIKIEHERSVNLNVDHRNALRSKSNERATPLAREEERIAEITFDYVISTNETGEAVIEEETSQVFE